MSISRSEVEKVSLLARLRLSDDELDRMTAEMAQILRYMELLAEATTDQVQPMAHPVDVTDVFREDQVRSSLSREQALANAPHHDDEYYRVPAVLGEA
ncbi:MAG: Asp-tRNA(Asn)/Glu-tRNA(Gln) amidotransferase subunit GatC [Pirellulales bacterium]|nr:Asp-tRNA(Asn)/Glu-tRNA(Gln) amidotransferase subunit GatC [Pirellulales bacterium]